MLKTLRMVLVALVFTLAIAPSTIALAESEDEHAREQIQRCIDAQPNNPNPRPCNIVDGKLVVETDSTSRSALGAFIIFAILWSAIPLVAGAMIASSRGQSIALALLLTFFLGWIGLAIVWFGLNKVSETEETNPVV